MRILIAGASGLVGTSLGQFLRNAGHEVIQLKRAEASPGPDTPWWNPAKKRIDLSPAGDIDAVVCLSGENISDGRWTAKRKQRLWESRVTSVSVLSEAIGQMRHPPKTFICASAIGFYGDRGTEEIDEESKPGSGFLASLCQEWEDATSSAKEAGIRTVNLRIGVVLSRKGGALAKMWLPFNLGGGGVLGTGKQMMSWIALEDLVAAIHFLLIHDEISGPVNATAPNPVTNEEFTKTLGRFLRRPTFFWMPSPLVKLIFGEMGDEILLRGAKVLPKKMKQAGYSFLRPTLQDALEHA